MSLGDTTVFNDRYEIQQRLGRGGMADVYLARDRLLERRVAVKVLFPEFATDPSFVARFRREAQAAAKTGTAQLNPKGEPPASHAWIIAFAPAVSPRYAIAVMVKAAPEVTAGTGGTVAGPIAKQILDTALALPEDA